MSGSGSLASDRKPSKSGSRGAGRSPAVWTAQNRIIGPPEGVSSAANRDCFCLVVETGTHAPQLNRGSGAQVAYGRIRPQP